MARKKYEFQPDKQGAGFFSKLYLTRKQRLSLLRWCLYALVLLVCVYTLYSAINYGYSTATGNMDVVLLGVEPVLFGIFCMGFDMLFIGIKRTIGKILADAKNKA